MMAKRFEETKHMIMKKHHKINGVSLFKPNRYSNFQGKESIYFRIVENLSFSEECVCCR